MIPTPAMTKRHIVLAASAVGLVAIMVAGLGLTIGSVSADDARTTAGRSTSTPAASAPPAEEEAPPALELPAPVAQPLAGDAASADAADKAVNSLITANNEILQRADGGTEGLEQVASGFVWGELQALATERERTGYKQVGKAVITSITTRSVDVAATPPTVVLDVCIDASGIDVVDANGKSVGDLLYQSKTPTLNVYGAQYIDGLWKITTHDIPDSAPCA
jgi:hypothetical protein